MPAKAISRPPLRLRHPIRRVSQGSPPRNAEGVPSACAHWPQSGPRSSRHSRWRWQPARRLRHKQARLDRQVLGIARSDPVCRRLMTIPGVGAVVALTYQAAIDDPARLRRSPDVGAHLGVTPRRHQSEDTDRALGISKMGDAAARAALFEAAHVLLVRVRRASALRSWGLDLLRRVGARRAKVTLARTLRVVMHRIWRDGSAFRAVGPDAKATMAA